MRILLFLLILSEHLIAGSGPAGGDARPFGMGDAYTGLAEGVWTVNFNPSGLASLESGQVSFFFDPAPFGLNELSKLGLGAAYPLGSIVFGISTERYGCTLYREFKGRLSVAAARGDLRMGVNLAYYSVSIKNYGSAGTFCVDAGVLIPLCKYLQWGASIFNANTPSIGISSEELPEVFSTGFCARPLEGLRIVLDVRKEVAFGPSIRGGFEYLIEGILALRGGMSGEPAQISGGVGIFSPHIRADYGFSQHQVLGWTHVFSVTIL